jgi:hypothetical protein
MVRAYVAAVAVGILTEAFARIFRLWLYRKPSYPVLNVLLMFGAVMGGLSLAVPALGFLWVFLVAAGIGYGYEQLNFSSLDWWYFPEDRFLVFRGRQACALSVGALWGLVPLVAHELSQRVA